MKHSSSLRKARLSELRAKWVIKQQQASQLAAAIEVLADAATPDDRALAVAERRLNAKMGV